MAKDQRDISLKELEELVAKVFSKDCYPKELPNGMYEIAKGCFTNKKGLEKFYEVFNKEQRLSPCRKFKDVWVA